MKPLLQSLKAIWDDYSGLFFVGGMVIAIFVTALIGSRYNIEHPVGLTESEKHAAVAQHYKALADSAFTELEGKQEEIDSLTREFKKSANEASALTELLKHIDKQTNDNVQISLTDSDSVAYAKLHARAR